MIFRVTRIQEQYVELDPEDYDGDDYAFIAEEIAFDCAEWDNIDCYVERL